MSLNRPNTLETFASIPGQGQENGTVNADGSSSRSRKLSFNPLPEEWDFQPADKHDLPLGVGAFEVPRWKRLLQIFVTVIYCLLAAGVVFGYAAIKPVLKKEGAYRDVCTSDNADHDSIDTCVEIHLNLMFTCAAVATNVAALPIGAILDHYGPRVCGLMGSFFLAVGALLMAYENRLPFDGLLAGYISLALGGPFTYISSFQLSNAFPKHSGLILALLTGAFDASSALFLVYRIIFEASNGSFGHHQFFLIYLAVPVLIVLVQIFILPAQSYKTVGELIEEIEEPVADSRRDQVDESTALLQDEQRARKASVAADLETLLGGSDMAGKQAKKEEKKNNISGVWGVMHSNTAMEQIRSPWFILICLFTVIQMTRINYFVATIRPQYESIFHDHRKAVDINTFFDVALPLGGLCSIPFIGGLLDHTSTPMVLTILVSIATIIGVLGVLPFEWAAYTGVSLFVLYRPFYYTAVSDYSAKVFGFRTFGTVYGTIICLSGLFNFSESGLDYLFHTTFKGNPAPVNIGLLSLGLCVGIALITFVSVKARSIKRDLLEREAEHAFES